MDGAVMSADETAVPAVDAVLLGRRAYTSRDVAALAGVPVYRARRFWRALGFPNVGEDAVEFTAADVEALALLLRMVADGVVDEQTALQLTRSLGQAAARLAESQAEVAIRDMGDASVDAAHPVRRLLPDLRHLLVYAWQRHLVAAAERLNQMSQDIGATSLAVGFADLVGFTRLARQLELAELAQLVERFESRSADVIAHAGGRVVKTLGDSVLFVAETPVRAADTALQLVDVHAADTVLPPLRVGVGFGPVVSRMGDVFGTTVNLANRLTAIADPDSVVDAAMATALNGETQYDLRPMRARDVRDFGRVQPFTLHRRTR